MAKKKDQEVKQQPVEAVAETQPKKKSASKNKAARQRWQGHSCPCLPVEQESGGLVLYRQDRRQGTASAEDDSRGCCRLQQEGTHSGTADAVLLPNQADEADTR